MPWDTLGGQANDTFTPGEPELWPQWHCAESRSLWLLFWILVWVECGKGARVTRHRLSVIVMSSVIVTNDKCATLLHTQTEITHISNPPSTWRLQSEANLLKSLSDVKIFQATFWVLHELQVTGNEQARPSEARIMFSDCNNQKTASDTIGQWLGRQWRKLLYVDRYYFSDNLIFSSMLRLRSLPCSSVNELNNVNCRFDCKQICWANKWQTCYYVYLASDKVPVTRIEPINSLHSPDYDSIKHCATHSNKLLNNKQCTVHLAKII